MRRVLCAILCLCLTTVGLSSAESYIDAEIEPYVEYAAPYTRDMSVGNTGEDVLFMQHRLYGLGYMSSAGTGDYGEETKAAVAAFQSAHETLGLKSTGVADKATLNALMSDSALSALLQKGDKGDDVTKLQNALIEYGFLEGVSDGYFGKETLKAVESLQEHLTEQGIGDYGLDGTVSAKLLAYLYSGEYNPYLHTLMYGDEGNDVKAVSGRLNVLGYMDIVSESFDDYMRDAIIDFQNDNGLKKRGVADFETFAALYSPKTENAKRYTRRELSMSDKGDTVTELQWALMVNGFMAGYTTGTFDKKTREALDRLQKFWPDYPDEKTDAISPETQRKILDGEIPAYTGDVNVGDKSEAVSRVQRRLSTLFYMSSSAVDGNAGAKFETVIKQFQKANGLPETGMAGEATQLALFSNSAISNGSKYILRVSTEDQRVYAYLKGEDGLYTLQKTMVCSTGKSETPTPFGIYRDYTRPQERWHYFREYACWAQYTYIISGNILFHSVLYSSKSENATNYVSVYNLGKKASHGCVRLSAEDAKWVFENCEAKTIVIVHPM